MPIFVDPHPDERSRLLAFLAGQRAGPRATLAGLTHEQVRRRPTSSALSIGALVRHVAADERRWVVAAVGGRPEGLWPVADPAAEWTLDDDEDAVSLAALLEQVGEETERVVAGVEDLGAPCPMPGASHWSVRWVLLHLLEENARHCGHADLLREEVDGATAAQLGS